MRALLLTVVLSVTACSSSSTEGSAPADVGAEGSLSCPPKSCGSPPPVHCESGSATLTCAPSNGTCTWGFTCPDADAGADTSTDAATDAAADAPACPTMLPARNSSCAQIDQVCIYGCGIVRRCKASGWDDDFTVDGGPPCP
jgi:hypothetical protein